jgi:hypothetical protein
MTEIRAFGFHWNARRPSNVVGEVSETQLAWPARACKSLARAEVMDQAATRNRMSKAFGPARWLSRTVAPTKRSWAKREVNTSSHWRTT